MRYCVRSKLVPYDQSIVRSKIAWVSNKGREGNCLSIDIDRTQWNAWVLKSLSRSIDRSKIAWVLESLSRSNENCLTIEIDRTRCDAMLEYRWLQSIVIEEKLLDYWSRDRVCLTIDLVITIEIAWVLKSIERDRKLLEYWNRSNVTQHSAWVSMRWIDRRVEIAWLLILWSQSKSLDYRTRLLEYRKLLEYRTRSRRKLLEYWYRYRDWSKRQLMYS